MEINFSCEFCGRDMYTFAENIELVVNPPFDVMVDIECCECGTPNKLKICIDLVSDIALEATQKLPFFNEVGVKRKCAEVLLRS